MNLASLNAKFEFWIFENFLNLEFLSKKPFALSQIKPYKLARYFYERKFAFYFFKKPYS